ncbi:MAG: ABC transporter permease [Beijerinckiaceae bacterium]
MDYYLKLLAFGDTGWGDELLGGALITFSLALATLPFGLAIGLAVALLSRSRNMAARGFATAFTTFFRGVPELLTLYIIGFGLPIALQKLFLFFGIRSNFELPAFVAGMLALGLVVGAFSSEVWNGALNAITKSQHEAAAALGLTRRQAFRLVVFPQLLRVALPGIGNNWMVLLKETSLVSVLALPDLMFWTGRANVVTKEPFLFFGAACLIYFAFSLVSQAGLDRMEHRLYRGAAR